MTTTTTRTKEKELEKMLEYNKLGISDGTIDKTTAKHIEMLFKNAQKVGNKIFCDLPLDVIDVDREMYQRPLQSHVRKIARDWNDDKCDPLMVNYRNNGRFYVIDGQHRLEAARMRGIETLVCVCFVGLTLKEEADIFTEQNEGTKKLTPYDTYKANLCRGEEIDTKIHKICEKYGVKVIKSTQPRTLGSVTMARQIIKNNGNNGEERLEWIFNLFKMCGWDNMKKTYGKEIMQSLNFTYTTHKADLDDCTAKLLDFFKKSTIAEVNALANVEYPQYTPGIQLNMFLEEIVSGKRTPEPPTRKKTATITRIA